MRKVICIGRQFGSGGHRIAQKLAKMEEIAYFDKKIFAAAVEKSGISEQILKKAEELKPNPFLQPIYYEGNSKEYYGKNANDILFEVQKQIILEIAEEQDCVIVGRCADQILKSNTDYKVISAFIVAPMECRIRCVMEREGLNEKDAATRIRKEDKARAAYYSFYTDKDWGKPSDYDFCINVSDDNEEMVLSVLDFIYKELK